MSAEQKIIELQKIVEQKETEQRDLTNQLEETQARINFLFLFSSPFHFFFLNRKWNMNFGGTTSDVGLKMFYYKWENIFDPPKLGIFFWGGERICRKPIYKYLREFLSDFNAHILLFPGLFRTFFSAKFFEI